MTGLDDHLRRELGRHVRRLRTEQQLTLSALAERVDISPSALSQIERGKSEPSLGTLWRLGGALKASLFDFFAHDHPAPVDVTRAGERTVVEFDRFRYEAIAQSSRRTIDLFVLRLEPGDGPVRDVVRHAGEEAGLVISGSMDVIVAGESHRLDAGDGIWFVSDEPHTFATAGAEPCVSVWADTIPEADGESDAWSHSLFGSPAVAAGAPRSDARPPRRHAAGTRPIRTAALALARALPIEQDQLREVVGELSAIGSRDDGFRVTGTPEDRAAASLVADRMRALGLEDVAEEPLTVDGWRLGQATLDVDGRVISGASLGGTPATPSRGIRARLVDGAGGERRRLDRLDIEGAIVLVDWHTLAVSPAEVAAELGARGAVGMVVASFEGGPLYQAPGAIGAFNGGWYDGAPPVLTIAKEPAAALRAQLRDRELVGELRVEAELSPESAGVNVVGWLPGSEPGPPIVIGAHHDAWFAGAFDNATGVATLLALAGGLIRAGHRPRHSLCFTSRTGEEYGLACTPFDWCVGAWGQISAQHPEWADAPFHLCLEASGHPGLRNIVEAPPELSGWARSACRAAAGEGWLPSGWRVGPPVTGTEQWPYLLAGVPGLASYCWETSFRRTAYHTPMDTASIVDLGHLERTARLDALLLAEADADPDAIHDPRARSRQLVAAADELGADGAALAAAARRHADRRGRGAFAAIGRAVQAVDAHGDPAHPHAQSAGDLRQLDRALAALADDDRRGAIRALEAVGANRLTRVLSAPAFAAHLARCRPDAPRLSWAQAGQLTPTPDLWAELASLRGETGSRAPGAWLTASLRRHRTRVQRELRQRLKDMTHVLQSDPTEIP